MSDLLEAGAVQCSSCAAVHLLAKAARVVQLDETLVHEQFELAGLGWIQSVGSYQKVIVNPLCLAFYGARKTAIEYQSNSGIGLTILAARDDEAVLRASGNASGGR